MRCGRTPAYSFPKIRTSAIRPAARSDEERADAAGQRETPEEQRDDGCDANDAFGREGDREGPERLRPLRQGTETGICHCERADRSNGGHAPQRHVQVRGDRNARHRRDQQTDRSGDAEGPRQVAGHPAHVRLIVQRSELRGESPDRRRNQRNRKNDDRNDGDERSKLAVRFHAEPAAGDCMEYEAAEIEQHGGGKDQGRLTQHDAGTKPLDQGGDGRFGRGGGF